MKITADGLLGSAQKINNQKKTGGETLAEGTREIKPDSLSIGKIVNSRIESIEKDIREMQTSLARNQSLNNGLEQLDKAMASGGNTDEILTGNTFNGRQALKDFMGPEVTPEIVKTRKEEIKSLIKEDVNSLTKLQVELDNLIASDLTGGKKVESLMANLNELFRATSANPESISTLNADKVMQLIR